MSSGMQMRRRLRARTTLVRLTARYPRETRLFYKYRNFTMAPIHLFVENLRVCTRVRGVPGDIVECGVWRGGLSAAMAEHLGSKSSHPRTSVLFDSFAGLPPAQEVDGEKALKFQSDTKSVDYRDNCRASEDEARRAMSLARARSRVIKGWFDETLPAYTDENPTIAVLRLDGDWYTSIMTSLEYLFPRVASGGLVIIDDYGWWDGCTRAVHDYLSKTKAVEAIRRLGGATYLVKH
jgi:O-methyltransferase